MKVIHIVEYMHDQAVENWIFRIMREARSKYPECHWTFYCTLGKPGRLDDQIRALGGEVIHAPVPIGRTTAFIRHLRKTLRDGNYDVMHAHHDVVSAVYLLASSRTGVRRRIVHVHNTAMALPTMSRAKRAILWEPMRRVCLALADRIAGISRDALASMLGEAEPRPPRDVVVYYGIETSRFRHPRRTRACTRADIGVDEDARLILFAGRMTEYKNPVFVVDLLAEIADSVPDAVVAFAGVGPEAAHVERRATDLGLSARIRVLGWREDLAELMLASDLLVWPGQEQPKEGLGLGIVEAQAAGLPIVMSRSVPDDAIVVDALVSVVPLSAGPAAWGREAERMLQTQRTIRDSALDIVEGSHFSLAAGTSNVMALYARLPSR